MGEKQKSTLVLRGGDWIQVTHPAGTDPLLVLGESMRTQVIKVIFGERGYYGY